MTNAKSINFQHQPFIDIKGFEKECRSGWISIVETLKQEIEKQKKAGKKKIHLF